MESLDMILQGFMIFCLIISTLVIIYYKKRWTALKIGLVGLFMGFLVEYYGVTNGRWDYDGSSSFYKIFNIPIEVLMGYFMGMFLLVILIDVLYRYTDEIERMQWVNKLYLITGILMLIVTLLHGEFMMFIPLSFLALWGYSVSNRPSIPLIIGFLAFIVDILLEGFFTLTTEYYDWHVGVAMAFMLAGVFIGGLLTMKSCNPNSEMCFVEID